MKVDAPTHRLLLADHTKEISHLRLTVSSDFKLEVRKVNTERQKSRETWKVSNKHYITKLN